MKHDSVSEARADLARRITERAARMVETRVIVPAPGEPVRSMSPREWEHFRDEEDALRAANRGYVKALRVRANSPNSFAIFPTMETRTGWK
jgi:hypothetical protein